MKKLSNVAEWIWIDQDTVDQYAEFTQEFIVEKPSFAILQISAPTQYVAYINGRYVAHGQYADYPHFKIYDELDVSEYLCEGKNVLAVICYNQGDNSYPYRYKTPALAFCVNTNEQVVCSSGKNTLARLSNAYVSGRKQQLAPPVGYNLKYDFTKEDAWLNGNGQGFVPATIVEPNFTLYPRPIKLPVLQDATPSKLIAQGVFKGCDGKTAGERAQYAWLSSRTLVAMTGIPRETCDRFTQPFTFRADCPADGVYVTVDLDAERAGYLSFDIEVEQDCEALIAIGEHLTDLRIRAFVGGRNFVQSFRLKKGRNQLNEFMRRIAGRYLMLYVYAPQATVRALTIRDYDYPFTDIPRQLPDGLKQRIYDVGLHTLKLCFHEHYEDCPGREQALYCQDSRNQMLFGYETFEDVLPQKESLRLFALETQADGLAYSTAPGHQLGILPNIPDKGIPIFALYWVLAVCEYYEHTKDGEFFKEMFPVIQANIARYKQTLGEKGLYRFPASEGYFNFYEWSEGMEPGTNANTDVMKVLAESDKDKTVDSIPTALFSHCAQKIANILAELGETEKSDEYANLAKLTSALVENFYDETDGYYFSYLSEDGTRFGKHELTQAMVLYTETGNKAHHTQVAHQLIQENNGLGRITLSGYQLKYDGIIKNLGDEGLAWVLKDIENVFGKMCFEGATSFPEMEGGEKVFEDAASLCHGWSGVACYIYAKYLLK